MYESFFQFQERPFPYAPRVDWYFPATPIEQAYQTLARCADRAEGPGLLIGGSGTGKSLVCQLLTDGFRNRFRVALLHCAQLNTRRSLLQHLLFELRLPCRGLDADELRLSLLELLQNDLADGQGLLLVVDEAHTLPRRLFEDLRMITNVAQNGHPRVRLVLAGDHSLEETFSHPKLECFNQRLAARCYLQPLSYEETCGYVHFQLTKAGRASEELLADDTWQAIYHATGGVPRLINQVCDHALWLAYAVRQAVIDGRLIEEAWADLQQLPMPTPRSGSWSADEAAEPGVVEFGSLDGGEADEAFPDAALLEGEAVETSPQANTVTERLDEVQQQLDALEAFELREELPAEEMAEEPVVAPARDCLEGEPEPRHDPFDERFEQEEVVVDHSARLQAVTGKQDPTAGHLQRREIVSAIESIFGAAARDTGPACPADSPGGVPETVAQGPQLYRTDPEPRGRSVAEPEPAAAVEPPPQATSRVAGDRRPPRDLRHVQVVRTPPPDDHDLIVIVDPAGETPLRSPVGTAQRREYAQLFSRLRQS